MENVKVNKNVSVRTRNLVTSALLAAIICLVTGYILHIPTPNGGYAHIGDAVIYLSASILPLPYAIACSAIGAGLADLTTGAICCVLYMFVEGLYFGNIMAAFTITAVGMIQPIGSFIAFIILGLVLDKINFKKFYSA